eukprot:787277_1
MSAEPKAQTSNLTTELQHLDDIRYLSRQSNEYDEMAQDQTDLLLLFIDAFKHHLQHKSDTIDKLSDIITNTTPECKTVDIKPLFENALNELKNASDFHDYIPHQYLCDILSHIAQYNLIHDQDISVFIELMQQRDSMIENFEDEIKSLEDHIQQLEKLQQTQNISANEANERNLETEDKITAIKNKLDDAVEKVKRLMGLVEALKRKHNAKVCKQQQIIARLMKVITNRNHKLAKMNRMLQETETGHDNVTDMQEISALLDTACEEMVNGDRIIKIRLMDLMDLHYQMAKKQRRSTHSQHIETLNALKDENIRVMGNNKELTLALQKRDHEIIALNKERSNNRRLSLQHNNKDVQEMSDTINQLKQQMKGKSEQCVELEYLVQ